MTFDEHCHPEFEALLRDSGVRGFAKGELRDSADPMMGMWSDLTLAYVNPAWFRFASDNGAAEDFFARWTLGRSVLEAIPEVLRAHYAASYEQCMQTGEPWSEDYECSSPDRFRTFRATAYPLPRGAGLLVSHSLRIDRPHERESAPAIRERFADHHGWLTQCAHCRRFADPSGRGKWVWVEDWIRTPPQERVSHGICQPCADYYFGVVRRRSRPG